MFSREEIVEMFTVIRAMIIDFLHSKNINDFDIDRYMNYISISIDGQDYFYHMVDILNECPEKWSFVKNYNKTLQSDIVKYYQLIGDFYACGRFEVIDSKICGIIENIQFIAQKGPQAFEDMQIMAFEQLIAAKLNHEKTMLETFFIN